MWIYLNFVNPVAGWRDFKAKSVHAATDELSRTGHRQARFKPSHVGGHEAGEDALDRHAEMLRFQRQIAAEFFHESLHNEKQNIIFNSVGGSIHGDPKIKTSDLSACNFSCLLQQIFSCSEPNGNSCH